MSNPSQVEADALLARRLQEEEYMAASRGIFEENFAPAPPRTTASPDANPPADPFPAARQPHAPGGPNPRGGIDPIINNMFNHLMGEMYGPESGANRGGIGENIMRGLETLMGFQNPSRNPQQTETGSYQLGPRDVPFSRENPRSDDDNNRSSTFQSYTFSRSNNQQPQNNPFPSRPQPSRRNSDPSFNNPGAGAPPHRSERNASFGFMGMDSSERDPMFRNIMQLTFGGRPAAPAGGNNNGGNNNGGNHGTDNARAGGMFFGLGGGPMGGGGTSFFSGSTATAGPGGATASAQAGRAPPAMDDRIFTFHNPEDFFNFFRQNDLSRNEGGGDEIVNFIRTHVFGNGPIPDTYEDFINLMDRMGTVNRSATDQEIDSLPSHQYQNKTSKGRNSTADPSASSSSTTNEDKQQDDKCAICLGDYEPDEDVKNMPCGHMFHSECLGRWLKINRTCPICKQSLRPEDGPAE